MRIALCIYSLLCVFLLIGCGGKKTNNNNQQGASTGATTGGYTPTPTPTSRPHGGTTVVVSPGQPGQPGQGTSGQQNSEGTQVHVFKYSGKEFCGHAVTSYNEGMPLNEMQGQLIREGIRIHSSYKSEDGKEYPNEDCGQPSGDINVYVINRSDLQKAESSAGFCECIPKQQQAVCTIFEYTTPPGSDCR